MRRIGSPGAKEVQPQGVFEWYSEYYRGVIVREVLARVKNIKKKVDSDLRPLYRMAKWKKQERGIEKKLKAKICGGNCETVVFVQATPGEMLKNRIQQRFNVEPRKRCWDQNCPVCLSEEKGMCNMENVGYSILCSMCWNNEDKLNGPINERKFIMHGETIRTARIRCNEHRAALLRQINEALRLEEESGSVMNDKYIPCTIPGHSSHLLHLSPVFVKTSFKHFLVEIKCRKHLNLYFHDLSSHSTDE